jgi:RNase P/RNase MRP subunit p30
MDIAFPNKNEKEFIEIAEKLGTKELYLAYNYGCDVKQIKAKLDELQKQTKVKLNIALIAKDKDILRAKQKCNFVITESSDKDQYVLERLKPNLIFNFETNPKKDKFHYRISGLNQVLCNIARENGIIIGFSFSLLLNSERLKRAQILGRMMQNIRFCRKYKVKTLFASFARNPYEMRSLKIYDSLQLLMAEK